MCMRLISSVFLLVTCVTLALGDEVTARRYGEIHDDPIFLLFSLLERREVQTDLGLSSNQLAAIKEAWFLPADRIPGVNDLITEYKAKRSNPQTIDTEKQKLKDWFESELKRLISSQKMEALRMVLSSNQFARLNELFIQMQGPRVLATDTGLTARLGLSAEQNERIRKIIAYYEPDLRVIRGRYGRQQINARREDESREDRAEELHCLFVVMKAIEKDRDSDLLTVLTTDQKAAWQSVTGRPLPIQWPEPSIAHYPFESN